MRKNAFIVIASILAFFSCRMEKEAFPSLEFIGLYQLDSLHGLKFDLSGIVSIEDSIYVIADKPWNKFLYCISFNETTFKVNHKIDLQFQEKLDLEGVDYCDGVTYLVNERQGLVYKFTDPKNIETIDINLDSLNMNPTNWGNAGWEGIAVDCQNGTLYLVKERHPRMVIIADLNTGKIRDFFSIPETESDDFSDAKFENGFLYLIERNGNYVTKVDTRTKTVESKFQYRSIASHPKGKLYGPTEYGMGEALLFKEDEIWIGLDNNGLKVTDHAARTYGMSGKSPVILKFRRPIGF